MTWSVVSLTQFGAGASALACIAHARAMTITANPAKAFALVRVPWADNPCALIEASSIRTEFPKQAGIETGGLHVGKFQLNFPGLFTN
jgi:hypothetical protein